MSKPTENRLGGELRSHHAARRLLEELRRGRYADAAQLPSELELADVLGVSRTVVRDALSDLERDGYLERVRGIGALVSRDVVREPHGPEAGIQPHDPLNWPRTPQRQPDGHAGDCHAGAGRKARP